MNLKAIQLVRNDCAEVAKDRVMQLAPLKREMVTITGGTGFVGTWLTELITYLNDEFAFGTQVVLMARNVERFKFEYPHLASRKDVVLLRSDVRYAVEVPRETGWFIHAAGNPSSRFHATHPIETMTTIADGTASVLRAVELCANFKMFLNLSSGLVYGAQPWTLEQIPENYVGGPASGTVNSVYVDAKRYAETLCAAFRSQSRIPVLNVRPFAFVGPYQSLENPWAINNFVQDAISGNPIRVLGDGQTVRSYMYPSDMAFWLLKILTAGTNGGNYNLGSTEAIQLSDLAALVAGRVSPRPEIKLQVSPQAENRKSRLVPDVTLAQKTLGLQQTVPLAKAIDRTIEWNRTR